MAADYDPTDLAGQQLDKREQDARKRVIREGDIADIKWLMSSRRGRRMMWRLIALAGAFRLSFDTNAMKMAFNEGQRSFGNQLFNEVLTICPEMFPVMEREHRDGIDDNGEQSK